MCFLCLGDGDVSQSDAVSAAEEDKAADLYSHAATNLARQSSLSRSPAPEPTHPNESFEGDVALLRNGPTQSPTNMPGAAFTSSPLPRQDTPRLAHYRIGWLWGGLDSTPDDHSIRPDQRVRMTVRGRRTKGEKGSATVPECSRTILTT